MPLMTSIGARGGYSHIPSRVKSTYETAFIRLLVSEEFCVPHPRVPSFLILFAGFSIFYISCPNTLAFLSAGNDLDVSHRLFS